MPPDAGALARLPAAGPAGADAAIRPARACRSVRLARLGLFLLRLSDRLVRKHAGLLNRNIVLFEPYHAQRPESSDHHRLAALRSELEHAAVQRHGSRLDAADRQQLAARILADLDIRIETLPAEAFDGLQARSLRDTKAARSPSRRWSIG